MTSAQQKAVAQRWRDYMTQKYLKEPVTTPLNCSKANILEAVAAMDTALLAQVPTLRNAGPAAFNSNTVAADRTMMLRFVVEGNL